MADPKVPSRGGSVERNGAGRPGAGVLAAGADRASGERAKRPRNPLLASSSGGQTASRPTLSSVNGDGAIRAHRPRPVPAPRSVATDKAAGASEGRPRKQAGRPRRSDFATRTLSSATAKVSASPRGLLRRHPRPLEQPRLRQARGSRTWSRSRSRPCVARPRPQVSSAKMSSARSPISSPSFVDASPGTTPSTTSASTRTSPSMSTCRCCGPCTSRGSGSRFGASRTSPAPVGRSSCPTIRVRLRWMR
jgi:hypothetical protein